MNPIKIISPLIFSLLFSLNVLADPVDQLMTSSGLKHHIASIAPSIAHSTKQSSEGLSAETVETLLEIVQMHYGSDILNEVIRRDLSVRLSDSDIKASLAWFESAPGKRLVDIEKASYKPDQYDEQTKLKESLLKNTERVNLIRELDAVTGITQGALESSRRMQKNAMQASLGKTMSEKEIDKQIAALEETEGMQLMRQQLSEHILVTMLYTYRNANVADIRSYIEFSKSAVGQTFHKAVAAAKASSLEKAGSKMGVDSMKAIMRGMQQ